MNGWIVQVSHSPRGSREDHPGYRIVECRLPYKFFDVSDAKTG